MEQAFPASAIGGNMDDAVPGHEDWRQVIARQTSNAHNNGAALGELDLAGSIEVFTHCLQNEQEIEHLAVDVESTIPAMELASLSLGPDDVAKFTTTIVVEGVAAASRKIHHWCARGVTLEQVYNDLLGPAARRLGVLWEADLCDFAEVTIGLGRLHQLLRELGPAFRSELECVNLGRRLLLVPASGEQHMFGLLMVADYFARAGWEVCVGDAPTGGDLFRRVRDERFDVVGLAVGCERRLELLASDIRSIRATSCNKEVRVMVGGPALAGHPEYVDRVGADGMAVDALQALREAERLLSSAKGAD